MTNSAWAGRGLFGADGKDLLALDFDFDAEGRADVAALDDGAANPDVVGWKADGVERIEQSATARIADEGMSGMAEIVIVAESFEIADIFELASAVGRFAGEGPIARWEGWRSRRAGVRWWREYFRR